MAMPRLRRDAGLALAATALLTAAGAIAQQPAVTAFTAPDGTRFLLAPEPGAATVQWAVATPIDLAHDPLGHEGLAWAVAQSSLLGTWRIGSLDVERERQTVLWLDEAWQRMLRDPRDQGAADDVRRWDEQARELADPQAFVRRLAGAPAWRPTIAAMGPAAVLTLSTTRAGIPAVAALLFERREDQALRDLPRTWLRTCQERGLALAADGRRALRGELLALTMPEHPAVRAVEPASPGLPPRDLALATWQATQRPEHTVHVLIGDFDAAAAQTALAAAFATTNLPASPTRRPQRPRALAGTRRSTVAGLAVPTVALAWQLPATIADGDALATAGRWLADDGGGFLARTLRPKFAGELRLRVTSPWPAMVDEPTLLVVEAEAPAGIAGLADALLAACREATATPPTADELAAAHRSRQRAWHAQGGDGRARAAAAAAAALASPREPVRLDGPGPATSAAVHELLRAVFAAPPAIVEGSP